MRADLSLRIHTAAQSRNTRQELRSYSKKVGKGALEFGEEIEEVCGKEKGSFANVKLRMTE